MLARRDWLRASRPRGLRLGDPLKGLERIGRTVARARGCGMAELWPALGSGVYCDLATEEGLRALDGHLHQVRQEQKRIRTR